jgi:hypothetical protein
MAIDGGGGGGGLLGVTNSFTGTGTALELIGNHCMAYSGVVASLAASAPLDNPALSFTTGNYYTVAQIAWVESSANADDKFISMTMNGTIVYQGKWDPSTVLSDMNQDQPVQVIIPAYTEFLVGFDSNGGGNDCTILLTGRIYR